jgi:hypothetical protein
VTGPRTPFDAISFNQRKNAARCSNFWQQLILSMWNATGGAPQTLEADSNIDRRQASASSIGAINFSGHGWMEEIGARLQGTPDLREEKRKLLQLGQYAICAAFCSFIKTTARPIRLLWESWNGSGSASGAHICQTSLGVSE